MKERQRGYFVFRTAPAVLEGAAAVGKTEGEGPLGAVFDVRNPNDGVGSKSWEAAEAALTRQAAEKALEKCGLSPAEIDLAFGGDLLNQCTATTFGMQPLGVPHAGLFGACSTFALALLLAAASVDGGWAERSLAVSSSHFCSAEKQFRFPLEYGGQRAQTAQRTVTGAGACVIGREGEVRITRGLVGRITDRGVKDAANMGAAMAPAAKETLTAFFAASGARPADYDRIVTGDLGRVGTDLLLCLLREEENLSLAGVHADCGNLIYDADKQDVHAGGSGCGCSAAVVSSAILHGLQTGLYKKILFVGTGALMSPLTSLQNERIPCIAHAVEFERREGASGHGET